MENLPKDVLFLLAIEMNYADILNFCKSSKRIDEYVCKNKFFWLNKLSKPNLNARNYKFPIIPDELKRHAYVYRYPVFIRRELVDFFLNADMGVILNTDIPLQNIIWPILRKGIADQGLINALMAIYSSKHIFRDERKRYFRAGPDMEKYLGDTLDKLERESGQFSRHPFSRNKIDFFYVNRIIKPYVYPTENLTETQINDLKSNYILLKNVSDIIKEIKNIVFI